LIHKDFLSFIVFMQYHLEAFSKRSGQIGRGCTKGNDNNIIT